MKVKIEVTLDVNADEWADEYGCETNEVRADVKRWATDRLNQYDGGTARVVNVR